MKKIIFATSNEGKMKEIRAILADTGYEIQSLKQARINTQIVEDGKTFEENAMIKAETISRLPGMEDTIVLADDSGLEVDYLGGAPGVYSARFLGADTSYEYKNQYIINQLAAAKGDARSARFVCVIACARKGYPTLTTRAAIEGVIAEKPAGENGFGYDPIFYVPEYGCTTAELSPEVKNQISHRGKALKSMKDILLSKASVN